MQPRRWLADLGALAVLLALPLILLWPVAAGSRTLVPADNLYQWQPYAAFAAELGVPRPPHNELLSDLVLENLVWKRFIVESLRDREVPLWNPHLFAGVPFLAAGQHSAVYPFSLLFYVLPLPRAYGLFSVLQLWLAGANMYLLVRVLRLGRWPALVAGITYQLSAFFVVSVVFSMIVAAAAWLPLVLAVVESMIRRQEDKGSGPFVPIIYVILGGLALGLHVLAGHAEILVYTLLVTAGYSLARLLLLWRRVGSWRPALRLGLWLVLMGALGLALGSVQLIPLLELVTRNFREGSVTYADVVGWAYPTRQVATFLVPDFFGNPAHHGYWDLVTRAWVPVERIFWGIKNYVEAGSYLGILPLLLAVVAILPMARDLVARFARFRRLPPAPTATAGAGLPTVPPGLPTVPPGVDRRPAWILALLALASLLLVFGTPLYALLYYGLPGVKQLHSPFRWVFPYTLSVAVLAAYGLRELEEWGRRKLGDRGIGDAGNRGTRESGNQGIRGAGRSAGGRGEHKVQAVLAWGSLGAGLLLLGVLAAAFVLPGPFVRLADRFLASVEAARAAFGSGQMLLSYQWSNLLALGLALAGSGLVLVLARRGRRLGRPRPALFQLVAVLVLAADLLAFGWGFNPAADPAWLEYRPPAVEFLAERTAAEGGPWRMTTYQVDGATKTLNANIPWLHGLYDVRGYDSIIPAQYVAYVRAIEAQGELLFNRVAPIYGAPNLSSPLLDLLGVRYVATEGQIANPDYRLVYDAELRVYENVDVLPRAFALPRAEVVADDDLVARLPAFDPRVVVVLDPAGLSPDLASVAAGEPSGSWPLQPARIVAYAANSVFVDVEMPGAGWLVLTDSYFPGWKAYRSAAVRDGCDPAADDCALPPPAPGDEPPAETELAIARADGNFRAVYLEAGPHRVRFKYTPMSFKLGLYGTFMAGIIAFLLGLYWLWGRFYRESADDPAVKRVAKNSLLPMGLQLLNKVIDFAFAMLMLRILAPEMAGRYQFAVIFISYFDILVRFGLGTLLTREVSRDRGKANRLLGTTTVLRGLLWLGSLPLMAGVILVYALFGQMTPDIVLAIAFFALGLAFSMLADSFSSLFYAYEKMEYPAAIATVTALTRVSLGVLVLLVGWGFVGLAAVSVVANVVSATVLGLLLVRHCFRPQPTWERSTGRWMMGTSFPLMINHLLASVFFRIDVLFLKPMKGDTVVGYYGAAYKYVDGLLIIPQYFTQAIFPLMSRYATSARDSLFRAYVLSLRLLLMIALPVAAGTPFIARGLILILGGGQYLPDSMIALQLIIWFLPFSFVNSVTQYVLIAIDQQRFLTKAFFIGVSFNVAANLVAIPLFSYRGAAVVTVLSELALLVPFYYSVRKHLGPLPWLSLVWQPAVASAAMALAMGLVERLWAAPWPLLIPVGGAVYLVVLVLAGGLRQPDMELIFGLLPLARLRARLRPGRS